MFSELHKRIETSVAQKFQRVKILSSHVILAMDMVASVAMSLVAYWIVSIGLHLDLHGLLSIELVAISAVASIISFLLCGTYRKIIRHTTMQDLLSIGLACLVKELLMLGLFVGFFRVWTTDLNDGGLNLPLIVAALDLMLSFIVLSGMRITMVVLYDSLLSSLSVRNEKVMIYGVGKYASQLQQMLKQSRSYELGGYLRYDSNERSQDIGGQKVWSFNSKEDLARIFDKSKIRYVIFPTQSDLRRESNRLVAYCQENKIKMLFSPEIDSVGAGGRVAIREINIEDLLGREEIVVDLEAARNLFGGKTVLVTGAAGSIGSELCRQLAKLGVGELVLFDNAETPLHELRLEMEKKWGVRLEGESTPVEVHAIIGDVRSEDRLKMVFDRYRPQIVFHAAAYKHVPLMEENPCEAVMVNVIGSRNVANCCVKYDTAEMIMISTDKAVNPTNVMGATKRAAEMYVQGIGKQIQSGAIKGVTRFTTTRFGNVLGSNGSVIPLFRKQLESGGPLTVTSERINRFFMSIPEACRLVMQAAVLGQGNDIFVFDMGEPVKIIDLARRMITLAGYVPNEDIKIEITGLRPGEKLYEEVLSDAENTIETENKKIRRAKVRDVDYELVNSADEKLAVMAMNNDVFNCVKALKELVPEFKSQNSKFEFLDVKK